MAGSISSGPDLTGASSLYFAGITGSSSLTGGQGTGTSQSSASISGPGQLLSNLQQLQAKDPVKFKQVVAAIASQLQAAAQQTQGPQSDFLTNLAGKFQNVANGDSLSQLQPPQRHHVHRGHHAHIHSDQGSSQSVAGLAQPGTGQGSTDSDLQQLFASIAGQVSQALKA